MSERIDDSWLGGFNAHCDAPFTQRKLWLKNVGVSDIPPMSICPMITGPGFTAGSVRKANATLPGDTGAPLQVISVGTVTKNAFGWFYIDGAPNGVRLIYRTGTAPFIGQSIGCVSGSYEGYPGVPGWMVIGIEDEPNRICLAVNLF